MVFSFGLGRFWFFLEKSPSAIVFWWMNISSIEPSHQNWKESCIWSHFFHSFFEYVWFWLFNLQLFWKIPRISFHTYLRVNWHLSFWRWLGGIWLKPFWFLWPDLPLGRGQVDHSDLGPLNFCFDQTF